MVKRTYHLSMSLFRALGSSLLLNPTLPGPGDMDLPSYGQVALQTCTSLAGLSRAGMPGAQYITSLWGQSFSYSTTAGSGSNQSFVDGLNELIMAAGGAPLTAGNVSNLLRICFESRAVSVTEVKHMMVGLLIAGSLEPSHSLLAFCHRLREQGALQYIDPTECTSRESQLASTENKTFMGEDSGAPFYLSK